MSPVSHIYLLTPNMKYSICKQNKHHLLHKIACSGKINLRLFFGCHKLGSSLTPSTPGEEQAKQGKRHSIIGLHWGSALLQRLIFLSGRAIHHGKSQQSTCSVTLSQHDSVWEHKLLTHPWATTVQDKSVYSPLPTGLNAGGKLGRANFNEIQWSRHVEEKCILEDVLEYFNSS